MFATHYGLAIFIGQIVCQTAHLGTFAPVGAAMLKHLAHLATTTIAHTQCSVHKSFEWHARCAGYCRNFCRGQLSCQHKLYKSHGFEKFCFFRGSQVTLSAGMQSYWRQIQPQYAKVLHYQRVNTYVIQLPNQFLHACQFIVIQNSVDCNINLCFKLMCILHHLGNVFNFITGSRPRAKFACSHIHSVSAMLYGFNGHIGIARRCEQFYFSDR